ncbi:phosphatidylinositol phosphatase PTPRQ-like [Montipora foliosa]|uniref:phosphatidylinositol phosphatase PTPRQ-like n=1 Tax=Montipora foliosa TaxID=591990 RepID=UPI0035F15632
MEFGAIKDAQIQASSEWDLKHAAIQGRLNFQKSGEKRGAWSAKNNDKNQWLQIDLQASCTKVTAVASQGRNEINQWVTKYKLQYSNDGVTFQYYKEQGQTVDKEFTANSDRNSIIYHKLNPPIQARYIRFGPVTWHKHISMRVEIYGCKQVPTDLKVSNRTSSSLTIDWSPVNASVVGYRVRYRRNDTSPRVSVNSSCNGTAGQQFCMKHSMNYSSIFVSNTKTTVYLKNLTPYTFYWIEVTVFTYTSFANESSRITNHTDEGIPTYPPRNVTAYNTSAHEIRVEWIPPVQKKIHGELAGFDVTFMPSHNESSIHHMMIFGSKREVYLSSLTVFTFYNITVAAFTKVGIGNASNMIQTRTDESTPAVPPENFTAESRSFDSINASWKPVPIIHQRGIIIEYKLNVTNSNTTVVRRFQRNVTSTVIENL